MTVVIELGACINCGLCRRVCPTETIHFFSTNRRTHVVEPSGCIDCDKCVQVCPENCITYDSEYAHDPLELVAAKTKAKAWAHRQNETRQNLRARALAGVRAAGAANA